jgi:homoserine kinase
MSRAYVNDVARVCVPASSANLGPGFDTLALALDILDEYKVQVTDEPGVRVSVTGESADEVPGDETHLVARAFVTALAAFDAELGSRGAQLTCRNLIPHGRGLGSSAAAIVGGVRLAADLVGGIDLAQVLDIAAEMEGHPDNAAAAVYGGFVIAWTDASHAHCLSLSVESGVRAVLFVPKGRNPTAIARKTLPSVVPHAAGAFNASRAALLVRALTADPELLLAATEDQLHQEQRRPTYPESLQLVDQLRDQGWPAMISGAGPTVLVLTETDQVAASRSATSPGFTVRELAVTQSAIDSA